MSRTRRYAALTIAAIVAAFLGYSPAEAAKPVKGKVTSKRPQVKLGIIQTLFRDTPEPLMQILMRPFKALMEDQTGVYSTLVNGGDHFDLGKKISEDTVQLGVFHGIEFAWAKQKYPDLEPMLIAVNQDNFLRTHLVVRNDAALDGIGDLEGKILAMPRMSREHCRLYLERRCTLPGVAPNKFYSQVIVAGDVEESLDLVVDGKATAAIIDKVELEGYTRGKPGRAAKLKTMLQSEPFPCAVVAYNGKVLPEKLVERFKEGMIAANTTRKGQAMLSLCRITGFDEIPESYSEMLEEIVKSYPPPGDE